MTNTEASAEREAIVRVTPEDREAAGAVMDALMVLDATSEDRLAVAEIAARHRIAAEERCARIAETRAVFNPVAREIATAIREQSNGLA